MRLPITEVNKDMTLEEYFHYNEAIGLTVEVNDGQVTGVNIEEA